MNEIKLKYTLIIFKIQKENNFKKNSESDFLSLFLSEIKENKEFLDHNFFSNDFISDFLSLSHSLCVYEALTFMSDDISLIYAEVKVSLQKIFLQMNDILTQNHLHFTQDFSQEERRKFVAMLDVFSEWCDDIEYFSAGDQQKEQYLSESPLISLCHI